MWKVCKLRLKGEISIVYLEQKAELAVKENAQLRDDYLRLKQTRTREIGNTEILILPFVTPIENSNLKNWRCTRRINGQMRLEENI